MTYAKTRSGSRVPQLMLVAGLGLLAATAIKRDRLRRIAAVPPDSAPGRTSRQTYYGKHAVVGRTVTINRPRAELYAYWRDFGNLPQVMENIESVEVNGDVSLWTIRGPGSSRFAVKTRVVADRENEEIAWRSIEGSEVDTEGKVMFRDAPGNRGTEVEAVVAYVPPAGEVGRLIAKLFQREPRIQGRREMKRFKMLMETGEVTTSRNRNSD